MGSRMSSRTGVQLRASSTLLVPRATGVRLLTVQTTLQRAEVAPHPRSVAKRTEHEALPLLGSPSPSTTDHGRRDSPDAPGKV
jgi:hypothetical protein